MSSRRKWGRKKKEPKGYDVIRSVLEALDTEMREAVNAPHEGKRKVEALWPIHQINWQRSRYIFDMHYKYKRISRELYDWCCREKLCDRALAAKWRKPGYERLCSVHVINTRNTNFRTTSICRVPRQQLDPDTIIECPLTGCRGCCSGSGGYRNIFGNKYGQYLADIQIAREDAARERGKVYVPKKEWTFALDDEEEEQAGSHGTAKARQLKKKDEEKESWLGGDADKSNSSSRKRGREGSEESDDDDDDDDDDATDEETDEDESSTVAESEKKRQRTVAVSAPDTEAEQE